MTIDWTINASHIITAVTLVFGTAGIIYTLRGDVAKIKADRAAADLDDLKQLVHVLIQIGRQDEQIKSIIHRLDKLEDRN